jgi:hypothetical protein
MTTMDKVTAPIMKNIRLVERMSEETPCFMATLVYNGQSYAVRNDGRGGCNRYQPHLSREAQAELDRWAAANNPPCEMAGMEPFPMSFETWTFTKACDALQPA